MSDPPPVRLTRAQVRAVDRRAIEQYHVPSIVLMENAARAVAFVAHALTTLPRGPVLVVCGGGNNGGDGLAVARHLHNRRVAPEVVLTVDPARYTGDALINWRIVERMNLPVIGPDRAEAHVRESAAGLIVDAVFGTGLTAPPRADQARVIDAINAKGLQVLAVDLPSGLDCDTGESLGPSCVRADETITFVAEKKGFANPAARQYTGIVDVADIGCPREIIAEVLSSQLTTDH